ASLLLIIVGITTGYYYEFYGIKEFIDVTILEFTEGLEEISTTVDE
ncbi:unnamed protein product, partial [marine sediment metagenome]